MKRFTIEILSGLTLASIAADPEQNVDEVIDAIAAQYHTEEEPALKKTLGVKYGELAKARNKEVDRKYFYETIQSAEKNQTTKAPVKAEKPAKAETENASTSVDTLVTESAPNGNPLDGAPAPGTDASIANVEAPKKTGANRVKITDEIIERCIEGIAAGLKPKEIAALKLQPITSEDGTTSTDERSMNITADNVYDIIHLRGRFSEWAGKVNAAKATAAALPQEPKAAPAKKAAKKAVETPTEPATEPNPGGLENAGDTPTATEDTDSEFVEGAGFSEGDAIQEPESQESGF